MTPVKSAVRLCMALLALALGVGGLLTAPARAYIDMVPGDNKTPKLHVTGRFLQDPNGNNVLLHGWYQPAQSYFNGGGETTPTQPTTLTRTMSLRPLTSWNGEADILCPSISDLQSVPRLEMQLCATERHEWHLTTTVSRRDGTATAT